MKIKFNSALYLVTDSTGLGDEVFLEKTESALKNGVTMLQLREKERTAREYLSLARKLHEISEKYRVPLIIDDRADIALSSGAEGVHLGQSDLPVDEARKILGEVIIIGATAKTVSQAREAYEKGADYLGVGAIFPTSTKVKTVMTSVGTLSEICAAVPLPINAIGGLNADNIDVLKGVKIAGICVVSAIMKAPDSGAAAAELRRAINKKLGILF